jgi:pimeloyl-ACP methyl ester carboxylesterase
MLKVMDLSGLRTVTVDLRGHGKSGRPTTGLTLDRLARDVWAVADDLRADRVAVVGFSMSAKFAQYVALLHPPRVAGVVLVAGCPASEIPFPSEVQRDWVGRAGNRERLKEVTRSFLTRSVAEEILDRWAEDAATVPQQVLDETLTLWPGHGRQRALRGGQRDADVRRPGRPDHTTPQRNRDGDHLLSRVSPAGRLGSQ